MLLPEVNMPVQAQIEHVPLSKRQLLEYLERQIVPVTAKAVSIDLDSRASTATEMLERCAAQRLVERDANQRPREYQLTDNGRRSLEIFHTRRGAQPSQFADPELDVQTQSLNLDGLCLAVKRQFEAMRELKLISRLPRLSIIQAQGANPFYRSVREFGGTKLEPVTADTQATAIRIAVAVWEPIYGADQIAGEKPYKATLADGVWTVTGSLPEHMNRGGVAELDVEKGDGRILRVIHGK